jgi:hypothetical protein
MRNDANRIKEEIQVIFTSPTPKKIGEYHTIEKALASAAAIIIVK